MEWRGYLVIVLDILCKLCRDPDDCCGSDECCDFEECYGSVEGCEYNYLLVLNFIVDCVYFVFF